MENKITLKELSKLLNVSVSTVSKALNDSPEISLKTRERVKELANLNHYVPNVVAQNLKNQQSKTIGVVIPNILSHFFAKALHGIETKATELGYKIIICMSNESREKEAESIDTLIRGRVDGLIISVCQETQASNDIAHLKKVLDYKVPMVFFDRVIDNISCDKISINDALQAEQAATALYNSGCRKIAYISGISDTSVDNQRKLGYLEAVNKFSFPQHIIKFYQGNFPDKKLKNLLKKKDIDGVLAADELSAILVMKSIINYGYKIPEDVSVIGFTNGIMSEHFLPSLTTVDQHAGEQGKLALETLVDRINDKLPNEPLEYKLETSLVHRNSTRNSAYWAK